MKKSDAYRLSRIIELGDLQHKDACAAVPVTRTRRAVINRPVEASSA